MIALTPLRNVLRGPGVRYKTPPDVRARYRHLYEERVHPTPDGGATFHVARLWRRHGINVLSVKGDRFEMAFQHGRLLKNEIAAGTLEMAGRIAHHGIRNSVGDGPLAKLVKWYADSALAETMLRCGVERAKERGDQSLLEGYGLSEGSGVPVRAVFHSPLGPEVAQVLLGRSSGLAVGGEPNQCTSFTAWGDKTKDGRMIIGRNTDYPLTGYYDQHPTVVYFEPTDGAQRYMCVTSAGCHNAATGGMNESGLYVTTHTVPASSVSEEACPVLMVGQQVLREAKNLAEAEAIIRDANTAAGWNYHVVSVKERRAMTFEMSSARICTIASEGDSHFTTNHWRHPDMEEHALYINETVDADTRARMERCREMIDEAGGELDPAKASAILGDKYDRTVGRTRTGPNTVCASTTVSSSVWAPDDGKVYVANGTAPVSRGDYVEMPTLDKFDSSTFADDAYDVIDHSSGRAEHARMLESEKLYQQAREVFEYENDPAEAADRMENALEVDGSNPALHLHLAMYALRAGRYSVARRAAEAVITHEWDPQRTRVARYLLGRIAAHEGDGAAARADLRAVYEDPDAGPNLAEAARKIEKKIARRGRVPLTPSEVSPMSWMPDAFRYVGIF